jgi:hypothetical protein
VLSRAEEKLFVVTEKYSERAETHAGVIELARIRDDPVVNTS